MATPLLDSDSSGNMITQRDDYINVHQNVATDELQEIHFDKHLKDDMQLNPAMRAAYRSVLGQTKLLQSRTLVSNSQGVRPRPHFPLLSMRGP